MHEETSTLNAHVIEKTAATVAKIHLQPNLQSRKEVAHS